MSSFIDHIDRSWNRALKLDSKIADKHNQKSVPCSCVERCTHRHEIFNINGMTGGCTIHFYNNLCSIEDARYLEIGLLEGSSFCAALFDNNISAVGIEDFGHTYHKKNKASKENCYSNVAKYTGKNSVEILEKNCWDVTDSDIKGRKFNIYIYDGHHSQNSHSQSLEHYIDWLDDEFIYIVDDWNWKKVRTGTNSGIENGGFEILHEKKAQLAEGSGGKSSRWHNGIAVFLLKKPS